MSFSNAQCGSLNNINYKHTLWLEEVIIGKREIKLKKREEEEKTLNDTKRGKRQKK